MILAYLATGRTQGPKNDYWNSAYIIVAEQWMRNVTFDTKIRFN